MKEVGGFFARCAIFTCAVFLAALVMVGCHKQQNIPYAPFSQGPWISGVTYSPAKGVYLFGDSVTFTVEATPTSGGVLSYAWDFGDWAVTDGDLTGISERVTLRRKAGIFVFSVTVTETLPNGGHLSAVKDNAITVAEPPSGAPVVIDIVRSGWDLFASVGDPDGDDFTVSWTATDASFESAGSTHKTVHAKLTPSVSPAPNPFETDVTATITDQFGLSSSLTRHFRITAATASVSGFDSLVLYIDTPIVMAGEDIVMHLDSAPSNPLSSCNVRLLVDGTKAEAVSVEPGDFFAGYDGAVIASPPSLQQAGSLDVSLSMAGGTTEGQPANPHGTLATVKFKALKSGQVVFEIDRELSTYMFLEGTYWHWTTVAAVRTDGGQGSAGTITVME